MSKLKTTLGVFGLSVSVFLTGCAGKGTLGQSTSAGNDSEQSSSVGNNSALNSEKTESSPPDAELGLVPVTEVKETFDKEADKIKSRSFDNINFENAYFSFPEASEVCALEYEKTKFTWSPDEAYEYMCRRTDELLPGKYNDEEKAYEIRFSDCGIIDHEKKYPESCASLKQYKEMNLVTDRPSTLLSNAECYVEVMDGILYGYDLGTLKKRGGYDLDTLESPDTGYGYKDDGRIDMFDVLLAYPIVLRTDDLKSEETFHLVSGDISIAEAVNSANKCLSELELSPRELPYKMSVQSVIVLDIGDGCYAFCFATVQEYKNIQYDSAKLDRNTIGISTISNATNETQLAGHAVMFEKDTLCRWRGGNRTLRHDITETDSQTSVIPLEKAAELASNYLSWNMRFKAQSVSAVYKEFSEKDHFEYTKPEDLENRKITVRPCWKFVLKPTTDPKKLFHVYVDMLTGEVDTFVQLMQSEEE